MADWGQKLQGKLSALSDSPSLETLQTLAKWIGFNRKHSEAFCGTFVTALTTNVSQQSHYIQCISLVCLLDQGNTKKWDRLSALRISLAEKVVLPTIPLLQEGGRKQLLACLREWDKANSFGGPTVLNQIRKKLQKPEDEPAAAQETAEEKLELDEVDPTPKEASSDDVGTSEITDSPRRPSLTHMESAVVNYNFESTGVEAKSVRPKEFIDSCRTIANLSIVRDLRNDGALQLSSQLSSLPEDIRKKCAEAAEGKPIELDDATTRDFCARMNASLLDVDVQEQLGNIRDFRKVVAQTREARKTLITLMQQSRCEFGAADAAEAFLSGDGATAELKERQQILADAMELEGVQPPKLDDIEVKELAPLCWYQPDAKRAKTS